MGLRRVLDARTCHGNRSAKLVTRFMVLGRALHDLYGRPMQHVTQTVKTHQCRWVQACLSNSMYCTPCTVSRGVAASRKGSTQ